MRSFAFSLGLYIGAGMAKATVVIVTIDGQAAVDGLVIPNKRPTLTGYVTNPGGSASGLTVPFYNGAVLDGTATTAADGTWTYTFANDLADGAQSISVSAYVPGTPSDVLTVVIPEAETFTYLAAVTAAGYTTADAKFKSDINNLIVALKAAGTWAKRDRITLLAVPDSRAAMCIKTQTALTIAGAPTFTADRGYAGDGSAAYLLNGYNPGDGGAYQLTQNSINMGVYALTAGANTNFHMGNSGGTLKVRARGGTNDGGSASSGTTTTSTGSTAVPALVSINRVDSANQQLFRNGAANASAAVASAPIANQAISMLRAVAALTTAQLALGVAGGGLTAGEQAAEYAAYRAYLLARGASV